MPRFIDPGHIPGAVFIPGVAAVRLIWLLPNGKTASNVMHSSYTTPPARTQTFVNSIFTAVTSAFTGSSHSNSLATTVSLQAVGIRDMAQTSPPGGWAELKSNLAAVAGAGTGDPLPANVAFVISLGTDHRGQANRGRVYLPGFVEATNDASGQCISTARDAAVDFIGRIQTALTGLALPLCIAQPARAAYDSPTPPFTHHEARSAGHQPVISITAPGRTWDSTRLRTLH